MGWEYKSCFFRGNTIIIRLHRFLFQLRHFLGDQKGRYVLLKIPQIQKYPNEYNNE